MSYLLTIAGFDPSGGGGVLADVETFVRLGFDGKAVVTALTAQNRTQARAVHPLSASWVQEQAETLLSEEWPKAVKVGMLGSKAVALQVARLLDQFPAEIPVVIDPVLRASAGARLIDPAGERVLKERLLPLAWVIKPNRIEAECLLGRKIKSLDELRQAAMDLKALGAQAVVISGNESKGDSMDVIADEQGAHLFRGRRIRVVAARGTGCRFTSTMAVSLARHDSMRQAAQRARAYVRGYLRRQARSSK